MLTAITGILAALTGMVPGILQFFTMKANNAHAIALEQLRMEAAKQGVALQIDLANSQSDIQQQQHLYSYAAGSSGIRWVDALNILVRPAITLTVFAEWIAVKAILTYVAFTSEATLNAVARATWTEADQQIFIAIVGFWFGNRMLARGQQMAATNAVINKSTTVTVTPATPSSPPPPSGIIPKPPGSRD